MEIRPYEPGMAQPMTVAYNEAARLAPYSYPVSRATMAAALDGSLEDQGSADRHDETVLVAQEGTEVVGFAHIAVGPTRRDDPSRGGLGALPVVSTGATTCRRGAAGRGGELSARPGPDAHHCLSP